MPSVGWVHWDTIYDELPAHFSARDAAPLSGVGTAHVASIVHRWKRHGRIASVGGGGGTESPSRDEALSVDF